MNTTYPWIAAAAIGVGVLGCSAAFAQATANPNPGAVSAATGAAPDAAEPSAATPGTSGNEDQGRVNRTATQRFINDAATANLGEIAEARYAVAHSQSPEVKAFAQKMIHDHTDANDKLTMIAMAHGYSTPLQASEKDQASLKRLEREKGQHLNTAYSSAQEKDHQEVISMFRRASEDPRIAPPVRQFARDTLPVLQDHLNMANQLVAAESGGNRKLR